MMMKVAGLQSTSIVVVLGLTLSLTVAGLIVFPVGLLSPLAYLSVPQKAQGITGDVTYNPAVPGACGAGVSPDSIVYLWMQDEILVSPPGSDPLTFPMHWTVGCALVGTFRIGLDPGIYYVDLVNGAHQSVCAGYCKILPANMTIVLGNFTEISIYIRTGLQ